MMEPLALVQHINIDHSITWKKIKLDKDTRLRAAFMRPTPPQKEFLFKSSYYISNFNFKLKKIIKFNVIHTFN